MRCPLPTGMAGNVLGVSEPCLNDLVRRRKVDPAPPIFAGRRLWHAEHLLQAAEALGVLTEDLRLEIESASSRRTMDVGDGQPD